MKMLPTRINDDATIQTPRPRCLFHGSGELPCSTWKISLAMTSQLGTFVFLDNTSRLSSLHPPILSPSLSNVFSSFTIELLWIILAALIRDAVKCTIHFLGFPSTGGVVHVSVRDTEGVYDVGIWRLFSFCEPIVHTQETSCSETDASRCTSLGIQPRFHLIQSTTLSHYSAHSIYPSATHSPPNGWTHCHAVARGNGLDSLLSSSTNPHISGVHQDQGYAMR